jgi:hypothetical protein
VGAVDGERVQALLSVMQKEGLIERPSDNRVRLTMAAWNRLDRPQNAAQAIETSLFHIGRRGSAEEEAFPLEAGATIRAHCRNCGPNELWLCLLLDHGRSPSGAARRVLEQPGFLQAIREARAVRAGSTT